MSEENPQPQGYKLGYKIIDIDDSSELYKALKEGGVDTVKKEVEELKESWGKNFKAQVEELKESWGEKYTEETFSVDKIRYSGSGLLSIILSSDSKNKAKTLEALTSEGMSIDEGLKQHLKGDRGRLDYTQGEIKIIADAIKNKNVEALLGVATLNSDKFNKKDGLINLIHDLRDGELAQNYKIHSDLTIECDDKSDLAKALEGKAEGFLNALDVLQKSIEKDGIEFDINKVQIDRQNLLEFAMTGHSSEKHQIIKILAEKGTNIESGISEYLKRPPAHEVPDKKDINQIADAMMRGELATLRNNEVFKKCSDQVQRALDNVTRAMGINTAFNQKALEADIEKNPKNYKKISEINSRFSGLCDVICNYITAEDTIKNTPEPEKKQNAEGLSEIKKINDDLENKYSNTHLLLSATIGQKIKAALFQEYPHSVLNKEQQRSVLKTENGATAINHDTLSDGLAKVNDGEYVKFCVFKKEKLLGIIPTFSDGHSMLIKKVGKKDGKDSFIFFDPNEGTSIPMTAESLTDKLNIKFKEWNESSYRYNEVCFVNNSSYMKEANKALQESIAPKKSIVARVVNKMKDVFTNKHKTTIAPAPSAGHAQSQENTR
ncbi:MAG: hypothetical protein V4485_06335 [Pseudomonadota bacterium]